MPVRTPFSLRARPLRRFGRIAAAVLLGSAVLLIALPSVAAPTCAFDAQTGAMTVTVGAGETAVLARSADAITLGGVQCDTATVTTTDSIAVDGSAGGVNVTLDLSGGPFEPGKTPDPDGTSEIEISLNVPGSSNVLIVGAPGDDHLVLGGGGANLNAAETPGDVDVVIAGTPAVTMQGNAGIDMLSVAGGAGTGAPSSATVAGGPNDDRLLGGLGDSALDGGDGVDGVDYGAATQVVADLASGMATHMGGAQDQLANVENLTGSPGADQIAGNDQVNALGGGDGDDLLAGRAGDDLLNGGAGTDTVDYAAATVSVVVILSAGSAAGDGNDILEQIEDALGSAFGDILIGDGNANSLLGLAGDDRIEGRAGDDALDGGEGNDTLEFRFASKRVQVHLGKGTSEGEGADILSGFENVRGTAKADTINGDGGPNVIVGGSGGDDLFGRDGPDVLRSGAGKDRSSGQQGNDQIAGGKGKDQLDGGDGEDRCKGGPDPDSFVFCERIQL